MSVSKRKTRAKQRMTVVVTIALLMQTFAPVRIAVAQDAEACAPGELRPDCMAMPVAPRTLSTLPAAGQAVTPSVPGQPETPPVLAPVSPAAPAIGRPGYPVPGTPSSAMPSTLMPVGPPMPGRSGQPLPPAAFGVPAQPGQEGEQPLAAGQYMPPVGVGQPALTPGQLSTAGQYFPPSGGMQQVPAIGQPGAGRPFGRQVGGPAPYGQFPGQALQQMPGQPLGQQLPGQAMPQAPGQPAGQAPGAVSNGFRREAGPTFIERAFSELQAPLTVDRRLKQFGYSLFDDPSSTFAPVQDIPVGPDYVIGPGDTLFVNMWGLVESNFQLVVDRNGEVYLPKAGPVRVWGLKFVDMESRVRDQLNQYFTRVNVSVTMGPLRTMKVFILGEVIKPGAYTVSSISTVTNALFAAGGPSTQGSLRDIRVIRNNQVIARLDLYTFLLEGSREGDERLLPNDTVFIPPIGQVVALAGYVKRPAIYELKGDTTLAKLLDMGGGLTILSYVKRVQVERVIERHRRVVLDQEFTDPKDFEAQTASFPLQEGDFVSVYPIDRSLFSFVGLEGNVRRPGTYSLKPGMRVKDLVEQAEGVLPGTHMARADLARFHDRRQYELVGIDLGAALAGDAAQNLPLNEFDRLIVYHQLDVQPRPLVQITGTVYRPGVFELTPKMRVSDLVFRGNPTRQASLKNAEMYRADPGTSVRVIRLDLERILENPGSDIDLYLTDRDHIFIRQLAEGVEKRTVTISGRVKYPGEYAITQDERLSSLIERAGGFLPDAFPKGAVFTRESIRRAEQQQLDKFIRTQEQSLLAESAATGAGVVELSGGEKADVTSAQATIATQRRQLLQSLASAVTLGRLSIHMDSPDKFKGTRDDILLEDKDSLYVPQQPTSVLVLGAVRNSTAVMYEDKESSEFYIARAGGITREADADQTYILKPDGTALSSFVKVRDIEAGDTIVVPASTEPKVRTMPFMKDIATILGGFALPVAAIGALYK